MESGIELLIKFKAAIFRKQYTYNDIRMFKKLIREIIMLDVMTNSYALTIFMRNRLIASFFIFTLLFLFENTEHFSPSPLK